MVPALRDSPALASVNRWLTAQTGRTNRTYAQAYARVLRHGPEGPIGRDQAQAVVWALYGAGYSPATVAVTVAAMRSLWRQFAQDGLTQDNPWLWVQTVKPPETRGQRMLSEAEVQALLRAPDRARDRVLLAWLYYTGLRVAEVTSVCWRDLRREEGRWLLTVYGKGQKTRTIVVPEAVVTAAQRVAGPSRRPEARIWPLAARTVEKIVTRAAQAAGIAKAVSPHWFRHAYATHAIAHGAPLHVVQASLGHSKLDTTAIYLDVAPGESAGNYLPDPGDVA